MSQTIETKKRAREYSLDPEEFSDDIEKPQLVRQDAKVGDDLLQALGQVPGPKGKVCGRKMLGGKNVGKKCQNPVKKYGMCARHWAKWKKENPRLKYPGHY